MKENKLRNRIKKANKQLFDIDIVYEYTPDEVTFPKEMSVTVEEKMATFYGKIKKVTHCEDHFKVYFK